MSRLDCHVLGVPNGSGAHVHKYAHILLPLQDSLEIRLDRRSYLVTNQHLAFIPPGKEHHCLCSSKIIMINIPASMIKASDLEVLSSHVALPLTRLMVPLVDLIKSEVQDNPDSDSVRYLYYYLYDKLIAHNGIKSLRLMREHFGEALTIKDLAKIENYNVSYYIDWFRRQIGCSPAHYLRQVRMEKAREMLATTHYRLVDIAAQVGYNSNAAFTRAFHKVEGVSPGDFRQRSRAGLEDGEA